MNKTLLFLAFITSTATFTTISYSQAGSTAVPFLMIPTSVEANGMGGISTVANATSPSSMLFNPAQLGMHTQSNFLSTEINTKHTDWLPTFHLSDLWITNYSMIYGMIFPLNEHSSISAGIGYSRLFLNLGTFVVTTENGPDGGSVFNGYEASDNFSIGAGINDGYKVSVGMTLKRITSKLSSTGTAQETGTGKAGLWATDLGIIGSLPIVPFMSEVELSPGEVLAPFVTVTGAYALNNLGGKIYYIDAAQSDPLPRTARIGLSVNGGFTGILNNAVIAIFDVTVAREAENLLLSRTNIGTWDYSNSMIGEINITRDVINGKAHGYVTARRGYSMNIFETITLREGAVDGDGALIYNTSGYSVSTLGLSKIFTASLPEREEFDPIEFFVSHLEIRFNHSTYTGHPILEGTEFDTIVFSFRY